MTTQGRSRSGYSAWRLIAEELRREIIGGSQAPGTKLPAEGELAERFGVHRNTVRQAVAALAAEHLVVSRRGSGTFVTEHTVLVHRIGARTRSGGKVMTAYNVLMMGASYGSLLATKLLMAGCSVVSSSDVETAPPDAPSWYRLPLKKPTSRIAPLDSKTGLLPPAQLKFVLA